MKRLLLKSGVCAFALSMAAAGNLAFAQNEGGDQDDETTLRQDTITVTSRKKAESILDAPLAVTAFGEQQIKDIGLESIEDIQLYTPGFVFEAFATTPGRFDQSPRFRGIDVDTGDPFRQTASIFVDGLFVINGASGISLNDIERVEVIKGPQSAVFGRNTFGGAVNYISKTPGNEFAGDISASVATRDDYEIAGGVEGPLVKDVLSGRISASYHHDGGHYDNEAVPGEKLGEEITWNITGSLFFEPTDRFSAKLRANYFENDDGASATATVPTALHNCGPFAGGNRTTVCGALPDLAPAMSTDQSAAFFANTEFYLPLLGGRDHFGFDRENLTLGLNLDYEFADNLILSGSFGYAEEDTSLLADFDNLVPTIFSTANDRMFEMNSQEVRLSGTNFDDRLEWSVGFSHFDQSSTNAGGFIFGTSPSRTTPVVTNRDSVETTGVFGSLAYDLTDKLTLTAEGRYQEDKISDDNDISTGTPTTGEFDNFLPRVILDYQAAPSTLVYASYAEGNNPGGFNGEVSALSAGDLTALRALDPLVADTFDEEKLKSYELGVKHGFLDGSGSISAAVFFMQRVDQQFRTSTTDPTVNGGATVTYFLNRGETDIMGFEVEGNYSPTDFLTFSGSLGYVDAEFQVVADTVFLNYFGTLDASGQKAPRYPTWSGSASALLEHDFGTGLPLFARADLSYIGERYADISNIPFADDGAILNLRAGMRQENYSIEAFVKNATNSEAFTGVGRTSDAATFFATYAYRTGLRDKPQFGVRLNASF